VVAWLDVPIRPWRLSGRALVVAACGVVSTRRHPTPADFPGIASEPGKRGILIEHATSGDAGCDDPVLSPTAISFEASGLDQSTRLRVHLYVPQPARIRAPALGSRWLRAQLRQQPGDV
jgi:hypothetical protein